MTHATTHRRARRDRSGFTLLEMLVAVFIIALLIGLLFPIIGKARDAARTTTCIANLRGIGQAFGVYRVNNGNLMPPLYISAYDAAPPKTQWNSRFLYLSGDRTAGPMTLTWADALIADAGASRDLLNCPASDDTGLIGDAEPYERVDGAIEYAINGLIGFTAGRLVGTPKEPSAAHTTTWNASIMPKHSLYLPWPFARITRASEGMLVMDNAAPRRAAAHVWNEDDAYLPGKLRHRGRDAVNMLFMDGHVETRVPGPTTSPQDAVFDSRHFGPLANAGTLYTYKSGVQDKPATVYAKLKQRMPTPLWRPWQPFF
jgi:prepilin-type N-terminal cleavage/methylation domain-containing protein/prepilin-type processing-associated H-X9-DG protein